ncbi:MAG: hypothetical protein JXA57_20540, partial [Armatimonadetes bacterium]|nr:hypothetical protein [Armatimonadota bacterium]
VMPMACEGWWLFGERGLAAVDRPVLMLAGTEDALYPENALIFEHLTTPDKTFISVVGQGHMIIMSTLWSTRLAHFAVAFFGLHLQGRAELAPYLTPEGIADYPDFAWGPVVAEE